MVITSVNESPLFRKPEHECFALVLTNTPLGLSLLSISFAMFLVKESYISYSIMAYVGMAYVGMAYIVKAFIVMARGCKRNCTYTVIALHRYGPI